MGLVGPRYVDGQLLDLDGVTVRLKVNSRARRITLRVDAIKGGAVVVAPTARHLADAAAFARSRRDWLAQRLAKPPERPVEIAPHEPLLVFGDPWSLRPDGRRPRLADGEAGRCLVGCGDGVVDPQLVARAVRREAALVFSARASVHCAALGAARPPISVVDTRSRWGSCSPPRKGGIGAIRLSWRLALAPFEVSDYVVAHECAHLLEANHGPRFWAHVHALVGDVRPHRAWLRTSGAKLHAVLPKT